MPTTAETSQAKRVLSALPRGASDEESGRCKRQRVRFDDDVEVLRFEDHEEAVSFVLSVGDDGDWDYAIAASPESEDVDEPQDQDADDAPAVPPYRSASPFAACDRRLCEELLAVASEDESQSRVDAGYPLPRPSTPLAAAGGDLKVPLGAAHDDRYAVIPLITPPSSPRRVRTVSRDGTTEEEATICEWPCGLVVDAAIQAAMESEPPALPLGSSCSEG